MLAHLMGKILQMQDAIYPSFDLAAWGGGREEAGMAAFFSTNKDPHSIIKRHS